MNDHLPDEDSTLYGMLVVLGTNGSLPGGNKNKKRSCFRLYRRNKPNGVKPGKSQEVPNKCLSECESYTNSKLHSISYTLKKKVIVVPYEHDNETDMFQVGRSAESQIDFVVIDVVAGSSLPTAKRKNYPPTQSTISRFACRILCDRKPPYTARIYAAGFDSSMNISLGEKAPKWKVNTQMTDGLTTNGVLMMQPENGFNGSVIPGKWKEVSVGGAIYHLREARSSQIPGAKIDDSSNVLTDGTLIDLCGTTLLWRSAESINDMPNPHDIDMLVSNFNSTDPQCPVGLSTLAFPSRDRCTATTEKQPWVYLKCGHVHGRIEWGQQDIHGDKMVCPLCRSVGKYVPLWMGNEPSFYIDCGSPSYCFAPCGHVCSEGTAKYWSKTVLPHGTQAYNSVCPFCALPLDPQTPYKRLIWQILKNIDDE